MSCLFARIFNSSIIDSGKRREIVFVDGLSFDSVISVASSQER